MKALPSPLPSPSLEARPPPQDSCRVLPATPPRRRRNMHLLSDSCMPSTAVSLVAAASRHHLPKNDQGAVAHDLNTPTGIRRHTLAGNPKDFVGHRQIARVSLAARHDALLHLLCAYQMTPSPSSCCAVAHRIPFSCLLEMMHNRAALQHKRPFATRSFPNVEFAHLRRTAKRNAIRRRLREHSRFN